MLLADHDDITLTTADKKAKDLMRVVIRSALVERDVLPTDAEPPGDNSPAGLMYEQQKELLLLQLDRSKIEYDCN